MTAALELLSSSPSSVQQLHLLSLVGAMARSSEAAGAELAHAGAPAVLLQMVALEPVPRTQVGRLTVAGLSRPKVAHRGCPGTTLLALSATLP